VQHSIAELGARLGLRDIGGCAERIVYRQLFPSGLTALDALEEAVLGITPGRSHRLAQQEMSELVGRLNLPINERSRRRAAAREEWFAACRAPLDLGDLLVD
jgi:chromosome partitioning protein